MLTFSRLMVAEAVKLRRSAALRLMWLLPLLFIATDFLVFGRTFMDVKDPVIKGAQALEALPIKAVGTIWAGFFHPVMLALLPASVLRPEHRFSLWKHLLTMPMRPRTFLLTKALVVLVLSVCSLGLVILYLRIEWSFLSMVNPLLASPFPWKEMLFLMGWLLLGSLPLLALYLWLSDRINSGMVPIMFGIIGLLLNMSLSGQEIDPSWQRDLNPWILPYTCAQQSIHQVEARQDTHVAGAWFKRDIDLRRYAGKEVYYLPSGRKVTSITTIPDFLLYPPPPTPSWLLVTFSLGAGLTFLYIGIIDARRRRC